MMSIVLLGDRNPEHLLSYMRGLLLGEAGSKLFRYIWLNALPESIHEALAVDEGNLSVLATKATKMLQERAVRRSGTSQVNAVNGPEEVSLEGEVGAVTPGKVSKSKTGVAGVSTRNVASSRMKSSNGLQFSEPPGGRRETPEPAASSAGCSRL